jgi:hypothetical protein
MKLDNRNIASFPAAGGNRHGSTLVIVVALLGLLAFMGMVFYSFAAQERAASENFSDAAKFAVDEPSDVFDHMLRQVIVGPSDSPTERTSILRSSTRRHSLVTNLVGYDIHPHTGEPIEVDVNGAGVPFVRPPRQAIDSDGDGQGDMIDRDNNGAPDPYDWLDFVDSPAARVHVDYRERGLEGNQPPFVAPPAPDVDYTYPDINNLFLAYRGTAIRDNRDLNGNTPPGKSTFEEVKVIIPSFFRPQYMKSTANNGPNGSSVPTDISWISSWTGQNANRGNVPYAARSFRPHPRHIAGRLDDGTVVYRYVADDEAGALGLVGGFPFHPKEQGNPAQLGELGIWTGSNPAVYELDADNDGDGVNEGIWLDLAYPIQETSDGQEYAVLHSVTIYDLDSLLDLNVHGNLSGMHRLANLRSATPARVRDGFMHDQFISRSNLGMSPSEVNPLWALRRYGPIDSEASQQFQHHFGRVPSTDVEQANMEWIWLLAGKVAKPSPPYDVLAGRWGEVERVFHTFKPDGTFTFADLPRPGRSGQSHLSGTSGVRFGGTLTSAGRNGFDDNQDRMEGESIASEKRFRPFGHPTDYSGAGRTTLGIHDVYNTNTLQFDNIQGSPRDAILHRGPNSTPARWLRYSGYSVNRGMDTTLKRYAFGENGSYEEGAAPNDDLIVDPFYDALFEDPMETVFDQEYAQRQFDQIFGAQDLFSLQVAFNDLKNAKQEHSARLSNLASSAFREYPDETFPENNEIRERFSTLSNSLRRFALRHDLGADLVMHPNDKNRDGNGNIIDDDGPRAWEFTANIDNDAYPEFPPAFGNDPANGKPYTPTDPFRPQVRRMLTVEAGEQRDLSGQLPLSINHLLDVERTNETPDPTTQPAQFLRYMRRAGLRFRTLTEHPSARAEGDDVLDLTSVPNYDPAARIPFPPQTVADREFWARRDRQQLARDIYVLLYTVGGAQRDAANAMKIADYRRPNDPLATPGTPTALYSHQQLREMAQFAVNLVDAMDPDDVITKFEYDKNLGADLNDPTRGGWNLDDDPYTIDPNETPLPETDNDFAVVTDRGRHREDGFNRGVVYGVESQQLAISEVLAVGLDPQPGAMDHASTLYDDSAGRRHLFIELQNMQPLPADLATEKAIDMNSATWRIVRYDRTDLNDPLGGVGNANRPFRALAFLGNSPVSQQVVPGQRYTIASAADNTIVSSDLFVDYDMDGTYDVIAPNVNGAAPPGPNTNPNDANAPELKPRTNLDLIHPDHAGGWYMVDENGTQIGTAGAFIDQLKDYAGNDPQVDLHGGDFRALGRPGFDLVLQRRANTNLPSLNHGLVPGEDPNPWVDVDVFRVQFLDLAFQMTDQAPEVQNHLNNLTSDERREPLDDATRARFGGNPADFRFNSLTAGNNSTGSGFNRWQAHFDRDFANLGELLSVPLVGPGKLTSTIGRINSSPTLQALPPGATAFEPEALVAAAAKFLRPDFPNDTNQSDLVNRARDNRWYRLFQFLEVPSRVHRMLGNYVSLSRIPGKVNLNTIRHWEVYAGLVDNPTVMDRMPKPDVPNGINVAGRITLDRTRDENNSFPSSPRDRWIEYLRERDGDYVNGYDPQAGQPRRMLVPGMPRSNPFHSPGYRGPSYEATRKDDAFETTMFRTLTPDRVDTGGNSAETNRNWLELGNANQHTTPDGTALMHQHQILAKMLGNTTTVSNTFVVFASAAYFEAVEHKVNNVGTGLYRIGSRIDIDTADGKSKTNPGWQQRSVFIIDRTDAFKAFDPGSGDFDWQRLVKARLEIE